MVYVAKYPIGFTAKEPSGETHFEESPRELSLRKSQLEGWVGAEMRAKLAILRPDEVVEVEVV
jgi:hypothetical protein